MLDFSDILWNPELPIMGALTGRWLSDGAEQCRSCRNGTAGLCKQDAVFDDETDLYLEVTTRPCVGLQGAACPAGYSLCNAKILQVIGDQLAATLRPPTIDGLQISLRAQGKLRNYPASIDVIGGATTKSPIMHGNFGPPCVRINDLIAFDPNGYNGDFTNGDTITIDFNTPTNRANGSVDLSKDQLLEIMDFYCDDGKDCPDFAQNYFGTWTSRQTLRITMIDVNNTFPYDKTANPMRTPLPGDFYLKVKEGVYLLNYPPACLPYSPISQNLTGSFGPSNIGITKLEADDPFNIDTIWDTGDTLFIHLSRTTDYAGRGPGPWPKSVIDEVFQTRCPAFLPNCVPVPFGQDYVGQWFDRSTFQLTVIKGNLNNTGLDGPKCCKDEFEIQILRSGNMRHWPPTSSPASTCGGPNACPQVGFPTSFFWDEPGCDSLGFDLSTYCEKLIGDYGTPFPRFQHVMGKGPADTPFANQLSKYVSGSTITLTFTEYTNMGGCIQQDLDELRVPCYVTVGTCSVTLFWIAADDVNMLKSTCASESGTWVDKKTDQVIDNCQLPQHLTPEACATHLGENGTIGTWSPGLAPHQTCSDSTKLTYIECTAAGASWRIHETVIPQSNIFFALDFSNIMGTTVSGHWENFGPIEEGICLRVCALVFVITIQDATNADPPEVDLFTMRLNPSRGIAVRSSGSADVSPGSDAPSDGMQGDFGPPTISMILLEAGPNPTPRTHNSRGPVTGLYEEGCTILVGFDKYTNRGNFSTNGVPKTDIDLMFRFSKSLGSDYTGDWINCTLYPGKSLPGCQSFVITITNATGAGPPTFLGLQVVLLKTGNVRNYPSAASAANGTGPMIRGHFGPSSVYVERLVAADPETRHSRFGIGDTISLIFNLPTNRANMDVDRVYDKERVDRLVRFSSELAPNYTGTWTDRSMLVINITQVDSMMLLPYIGTFKLELLKSGDLRNFPVTSDQSDSVSAPLSGGFGLSTLYIMSAIGSDPEPMDNKYSDGDKITVTFSRATNKAGLPNTNITKEQLNNLFHFGMPLGDDYRGSWISDSVLEITIINSTKPAGRFWCEPKVGCDHSRCSRCEIQSNWASCVRQLPDSSLPDFITNRGTDDCPSCDFPLVILAALANKGTAECRLCPNPIFQWMLTGICVYASDGGYDPPLLDVTSISVKQSADLREVPPILNPSTGIDETGEYPPEYLSGGFGYSRLEMLSVTACDPDKGDAFYSNGDVITILFSEPTNRGNLPESGSTKSQIDAVFSFTQSLGKAYTGEWPNRSAFVITIVDATGNSEPTIDSFYITSKATGRLRDFPAVSDAAVISGNQHNPIEYLKGEFGPSAIFIKSFRASSPESRSDVYNIGAAFTILFSELTNLGGITQNEWTRAQIDNAFDFYSDSHDPHPLGLDYSGVWMDNQTFMILILSLDRDEPKGPPPLTGGNFRVSVKASGNIRNRPPQSAATVIGRFERAQLGLGGDSNQGINCDCCNPCGGVCDVCDAYSCSTVVH